MSNGLCQAGWLWFLPCGMNAEWLAVQGRTSHFDQLRKVPVCSGHAGRIKGFPLWVIRDLAWPATAAGNGEGNGNAQRT